MRRSSPHLLDLEEADECPKPVAGGRDGHVWDSCGAEHPSQLAALGGGCGREAFAHAAVAGINLQLLACLRVDEPDGSDVRQLVLARITDLYRNYIVARLEPEQGPSPVLRPAEVGD